MSTTQSQPVQTEKRDRTLIARLLSKNPSESDVDALSRAIDQFAPDGGITLIVIDLSNVEYLPSMGLGAIIQIYKKCQVRQQKLKLAALNQELRRIVCVTRLDRIFDLVDTVEGAVE